RRRASVDRSLLPHLGLEASDSELAKLRIVDGARSVREEAIPARRLRERDHVPDRILAEEEHDEPVEPERDARVGRRPVGERVEKEAELRAGLLLRELDPLEDGRL